MFTVYKITNKVNDKIYIGFTSKDPLIRFKEHCKDAKYKPNSSSLLHKAIRKHGSHNFIIESIYEGFDRDYTLKVMEPKYIAQYRQTNVLYNVQDGGEGNTNKKRCKKVDVFDKNLNLVKTCNSITEAADFVNSQLPIVIRTCNQARAGKGSRIKNYWVAYHGEQPVVKNQDHLIQRNKSWTGKKRPHKI